MQSGDGSRSTDIAVLGQWQARNSGGQFVVRLRSHRDARTKVVARMKIYPAANCGAIIEGDKAHE